MIPKPGEIHAYVLSADDAESINRRRVDAFHSRIKNKMTGAIVHVGSSVSPLDVFPIIVIKIIDAIDDASVVNGRVILDGTDVLWVTDVPMGTTDADEDITWNIIEPSKWFKYSYMNDPPA